MSGRFSDSYRVPANDVAVTSSPRDFDLSKNTSLRALEVTARSLYNALEPKRHFNKIPLLEHALLTMASTVTPEVTVFYEEETYLLGT